ncbi:hypothetical protein L195_g039063 [Trifolium pratense]|uniref:Uncharacterized protein n=1 Tax=Trifolium pratense TaxID=57577 RepID=A0A2K3LWW4_TRIPR|nr:hypothetical protein L195_g039063 [Trifolium pratense]
MNKLHLQLALGFKSTPSSKHIGASKVHDLNTLALPHSHNEVVVSQVTRVLFHRLFRSMLNIIPPPFQADVEYYSTASPGRCRVLFHHLSRPIPSIPLPLLIDLLCWLQW